MRGHELRRARDELGLAAAELGAMTGIAPETLAQWESFDLRIPGDEAGRVRLALWMARRDRILEESGLPACEWLAGWPRDGEPPAADVLEEHARTCDACRAQEEYARRHAPRPPGVMGILDAVVRTTDRLPAPLRSAVYGALLVLVFTGFPILVLLVLGIVTADGERLAAALAGLVITGLGGGVGGVVHFVTSGLRARGGARYYAAWILALYGYLAGMFAAIALLVPFLGDGPEAAEARELLGMLSDPVGLGIILAVGVFFGIALGRGAGDWNDLDATRAEAPPSRARVWLRRGGTMALVVLAATTLGLQWWVARDDGAAFTGGPALTAEEASARLPALQEAAVASPDDAASQYWLGMALAALERHDEALPPFERAIGLEPGNPNFQNAYGWSLLRLGRLEEAVAPLERAVAGDPGYHTAMLNLGWVLASLDRLDEAASVIQRALELQPEDPATRGVHARLLVAQRRFEEAVPHAHAAAAGQPENAYHRETLARAMLGVGRVEEAFESYREATRLAPEEPWYWRELGRIAHMMGRYAEADEAFARVEALEPGHFEGDPEDRALRDEAKRLKDVSEAR